MAAAAASAAAATASTVARVHIPPPPPPLRKAANTAFSGSPEWRAELLEGLIDQHNSRAPPYSSSVGDVKLTLDDLRSQVLDYYAKLYAVKGATVSDKLTELEASWAVETAAGDSSVLDRGQPSAQSLRPRPATSHADVLFPQPDSKRTTAPAQNSHAVKRDTATAGALIPVRVAPEVFVPGIPPHRLVVASHGALPGEVGLSSAAGAAEGVCSATADPLTINNFYGSLRPSAAAAAPQMLSPAALMQESLERAGLLQIPDPREHSSVVPSPSGSSIHGVMADLRRAAEGASSKLDHIGDRLWEYTQNPDIRSWHHGEGPTGVRRKPRTLAFAPDELAYALEQLYSVTWRQVKFNERRIRAQRNRLDLLLRQCNSRSDGGGDPRIGF